VEDIAKSILGVIVKTHDPASAALWLTNNLYFKQENDCESKKCVSSESFHILIEPGEPDDFSTLSDNEYYSGWEHIALCSWNIQAAIAMCKGKNLHLELSDSGCFHNPKVWGTGADYFNILSPFDVKLEVSQRLDIPAMKMQQIISGLAHIGLPVANIEESIAFYCMIGFSVSWPKVTNEDPKNGRIYCAMLELNGSVIELYEFADKKAVRLPEKRNISALVLQSESIPSSLHALSKLHYNVQEAANQTMTVYGPDGEVLLFVPNSNFDV